MDDTFADEVVGLRPRLVGFAFTLAREHAEAEDLVQETILRALAARDRFRPGTNLRAWLFTILRNLHLNRRRASAARPALVPLEDVDVQGHAGSAPRLVEETVILRAEVARIRAAMRDIPPALAMTLHLVAVEDLTYSEVAAILEVPVGTVMSRMFRARRRLLEKLASP